jgi:hypothetical protein
VILTAREQTTFKTSSKRRNSRFMRVKPIETMYFDDVRDQLVGYEDKLHGFIRRHNPTPDYPERHWIFKFGFTTWMKNRYGASVSGVSAFHEFEWTETATKQATRRVRMMPGEDPSGLDDMLLDFSFPEAELRHLEDEQQMKEVTGQDVELLLDDINEFCRRSLLIGVSAPDRRMW